jgi:hypothetical protein
MPKHQHCISNFHLVSEGNSERTRISSSDMFIKISIGKKDKGVLRNIFTKFHSSVESAVNAPFDNNLYFHILYVFGDYFISAGGYLLNVLKSN